ASWREPLSPDHVFNFHGENETLELEDPAMEVEEDPIEDLEEDLDMDIDEDEEDEWEEDDDWLMALVTPPRAASLTRVALHHREIRALCVRADKMEDMQTRALYLVIKVDGVDALREEIDGLHGSTKTMSQKMQTLETALQE
ncbi:hypothetical protein Tco_1379444, partial [Tanacetum coccineum]